MDDRHILSKQTATVYLLHYSVLHEQQGRYQQRSRYRGKTLTCILTSQKKKHLELYQPRGTGIEALIAYLRQTQGLSFCVCYSTRQAATRGWAGSTDIWVADITKAAPRQFSARTE